MMAEALRMHAGSGAIVEALDRDRRSPINVVLDQAAGSSEREFKVFVVDGALPEHFSFPALRPAPIAFSLRYVALAAYMRSLLTSHLLSEELVGELATRVSLRLIAEFTLRYGDPSVAAYLFVRSLVGQSVFLAEPDLSELESAPRTEAYMAVWFFGLLHEMGHFDASRADLPNTWDARLEALISEALDDYPYPDDVKSGLRQNATEFPAQHPLGIRHLSTEIGADIFAARALFYSSASVIDDDSFDIYRFADELLTTLNTLIMIDRCNQCGRVAAGNEAVAAALVGLPVAARVRAVTLLHWLAYSMASVEGEGHIDNAAAQTWFDRFIEGSEEKAAWLSVIEAGCAQAMREALFPEEREAGLTLPLARELDAEPPAGSGFPRAEVLRFCKLAASLRLQHPDLDVLRAIAEAVGAAEDVARDAAIPFIASWVDGPEGTGVPFGLATPDGFVVFVFRGESDLFRSYHRASDHDFAAGYALKTSALIAPCEHDVVALITQRVPENLRRRCVVAVEGSDRFARLMTQLADGTIWGD